MVCTSERVTREGLSVCVTLTQGPRGRNVQPPISSLAQLQGQICCKGKCRMLQRTAGIRIHSDRISMEILQGIRVHLQGGQLHDAGRHRMYSAMMMPGLIAQMHSEVQWHIQKMEETVFQVSLTEHGGSCPLPDREPLPKGLHCLMGFQMDSAGLPHAASRYATC